jgi:hypothetical protein
MQVHRVPCEVKTSEAAVTKVYGRWGPLCDMLLHELECVRLFNLQYLCAVHIINLRTQVSM